MPLIRDRQVIKGCLTVTVREFTPEGLREMFKLKKFKGVIPWSDYCEKRSQIINDFSHIKNFQRTLIQKILGLPPTPMIAVNHNIVTDEGDALVADIMSKTPARVKVDGTNGYVDVGTGWTGTTPKQNTGVNTFTGTPELMDSPYPQQKGAFGAANDNVTQYRSTYEAGDLNATGINESALLNNVVRASADCLAYAQITPSVNVGTSDTLQVDWEITYLGA